MTSIQSVMAQIGRSTADAKIEATESAAERLEHLEQRRGWLNDKIKKAEAEVTKLEGELVEEEGDDAAKLQDRSERVTAGIERDTTKLDIVDEQKQEQFELVLKQEQVSGDAMRSLRDLGDDTLVAIQSLA